LENQPSCFFLLGSEIIFTLHKGSSIKDVRSQGGLFSADILRQLKRGFFKCGRPHFLAQKIFGFFLIYGVSARTTLILTL